MKTVKKWMGLILVTALMVVAPLVLQISSIATVKAASVSTLAKDWGIDLTEDKKNIVWSADLIKAQWVDAATIKVSSTVNPSLELYAKPNNEEGNGGTPLYDQRGKYYDQKDYSLEGWHKNPCWGEVHWDSPKEPYKPVSQVTIDMDFQPDTVNSCVGGKGDNNTLTINVENSENSIAYFKWLDPTQLQTIDNKGPHKDGEGNGVFTQSKEYPNLYVSQDESPGSCQDRVVVSSDHNSLIYYELGGGEANKDAPSDAHTTCKYVDYPNDAKNFWLPSGEVLNILNKEAYNTVAPGEGVVGGDVDIAGASGATCESSVGSFGSFICDVLEKIDSFIVWAEDKIENQLTVDLGPQETRDSLQEAWQIVARLASGVLVAIALVMVISTALGSDLVSPYALKKVLPRLVIGAIGIWLSWALVTTYIDIVNDLGKGIKALMLTPFVDAKEFGLAEVAAIAGGGDGGNTGTIFVGLATYGIFSVGVYGLLTMGATALFAFIAAIFILALRQAVIVFLVIMAPLGFAMWILPNTQKTWKLWSGTLNKLLIMYPMIMGILTAGKIFAWITSESAKNEDGLDKFLAFSIAMIAFVAPYFFLPAVFKAAGGVFSNLTGIVNDKGKGFFDGIKGRIEKRKALSNRELGKTQKENLRKINRQARYAEGMTGVGTLAALRRRKRGGRFGLSSQATRDALQASAIGVSRADERKNLEDYSALLDNDFRLRSVSPGGQTDEREYLLDQATSSTGDRRQAAIDRLVAMRAVGHLERLHRTMSASADGRNDWERAVRRNFDNLREAAPHVANSTGAALSYGSMINASPEAAARWNTSTWESFNTVNGAEAERIARLVMSDPQLARTVGGAWTPGTTGPPPPTTPGGAPSYRGTRDFFGRTWGI